MQIGQFQLKAYFSCKGRSDVPPKTNSRAYAPFQATINGVAIPQLSQSEQKEITGRIDFAARTAELASVCKLGPTMTEDEHMQLLQDVCKNVETKTFTIEDSLTFKLAQLLRSSSQQDQMQGIRDMAQLILKDNKLDFGDEPLVHYFEAKVPVACDTRMILNCSGGDSIMSFDKPFVNCKFSEGNSFKYDAINPDNGIQEGMSCLWGMRYQVTPDGPTINDCGLVFLQMCTPSSRNTKAPFLAAKFREFLAKMAENHLVNSSAASSGSSSSSGYSGVFPVPKNTQSPKQLADGQ